MALEDDFWIAKQELFMAIIFELWVECNEESELRNLKEHFHNLEYRLLTGRDVRFRADVESSYVRGLNVWSPQICGNGRGIESLTDALEATEAGIFLYHRLKSAPDFRFAHVGWDAENFTSIDLADHMETMADGRTHVFGGYDCSVNDELYKQLGSPEPFWQFRKGYWWKKYGGETYIPLYSSDQNELIELCERHLPGNFEHVGGVR